MATELWCGICQGSPEDFTTCRCLFDSITITAVPLPQMSNTPGIVKAAGKNASASAMLGSVKNLLGGVPGAPGLTIGVRAGEGSRRGPPESQKSNSASSSSWLGKRLPPSSTTSLCLLASIAGVYLGSQALSPARRKISLPKGSLGRAHATPRKRKRN